MRQGQNSKRSRGRGRKPPQNNVNRTYDSNGPDVKIRGTAAHICEKYQQLARDAASSSDRVAAENYYQHAEHYYRVLMASQGISEGVAPRPQLGYRPDEDEGDEDEVPQQNGNGAPQFQRPDQRDRNDQQRNDRGNRNDQRGEQPYHQRSEAPQREAREPRDQRDYRGESREQRDQREQREPREQQRTDPRPEIPRNQPVQNQPIEASAMPQPSIPANAFPGVTVGDNAPVRTPRETEAGPVVNDATGEGADLRRRTPRRRRPRFEGGAEGEGISHADAQDAEPRQASFDAVVSAPEAPAAAAAPEGHAEVPASAPVKAPRAPRTPRAARPAPEKSEV
ncbi:MAG TPA: DUF4167 domain-containing protein [Rhizobium sp.]